MEITPPSFSNHSRHGTPRRCLRPVTERLDSTGQISSDRLVQELQIGDEVQTLAGRKTINYYMPHSLVMQRTNEHEVSEEVRGTCA